MSQLKFPIWHPFTWLLLYLLFIQTLSCECFYLHLEIKKLKLSNLHRYNLQNTQRHSPPGCSTDFNSGYIQWLSGSCQVVSSRAVCIQSLWASHMSYYIISQISKWKKTKLGSKSMRVFPDIIFFKNELITSLLALTQGTGHFKKQWVRPRGELTSLVLSTNTLQKWMLAN